MIDSKDTLQRPKACQSTGHYRCGTQKDYGGGDEGVFLYPTYSGVEN